MQTMTRPPQRSPSAVLADLGGWALYLAALCGILLLLPGARLGLGHVEYFVALGSVGLWRYSLRLVHFVRGLWFLYIVFPMHRHRMRRLGADGDPPHVYLLVTSFRIDGLTTAQVYGAVIREAIDCGYPTTVVASIVEMSDENLIKSLWRLYAPPQRVRLRFVRIAGTGKRDGLAFGYRAISRDLPAPEAVVAVIDGDTVLDPGILRKTAPYLKLFPKVGGLTTNEFCDVDGGYLMREWHKLRFGQRHLNMCSMALTKRVLTLTGRMSLFRADVICDPGFIADVEHDYLQHWRLGRFRFLTGDDKSSWYSLMRMGYDTYYVPDASIRTVEHPPDPSFFRASRQLMFRWYGNSLRQNQRASKLGPARLGLFTYYVLLDQRIQMWTGLLGTSVALVAGLCYGASVPLAFLLWIGVTRLIMTAMILPGGHGVSCVFPLLMYYNQIVGSLTKIYVYFHLDQQSWTRQKTSLRRDLDGFQRWFNPLSSKLWMYSAAGFFVAIVTGIVARRMTVG